MNTSKSVRQFRQGIREVTTEFPAGGIERKDGGEDGREYGGEDGREYGREYGFDGISVENALAAAKRELREETGYESDEWSYLLAVPSHATIADDYAYLFVARNCHRVSEQSLDETEFLNVQKHTAQEIEEMIAKGEFPQAVHIAAWLLSLRQ